MVTQNEYNVAKQNYRKLYYKFNILNYNFQQVDEIGGVILSDSWSINATSDIRRTGTVTLVPDDNTSYKIQEGSKIWLDKYIQVYIGIEDIHTGEIVYTNMGIYLINNPSQSFDGTNDTITLNLIDLMAKMTGLRYGNIEGYDVVIKAESDIKQVIIGILESCGFNKYVIEISEGDYTTLPNEIRVEGNSTYYNILKQINEVNIDYQMYFDVDGVFHYEKIPNGNNEMIMVDDDIWESCYINHNISTDYESLKNKIIVIGKTHDIKNFGGTATITEEESYHIDLSGMDKLRKNLKIGFVAPTLLEEPKLQITMREGEETYESDILPILVKDSSGELVPPELSEDENVYYVVKYKKSIDEFEIYDVQAYSEEYTGDLLATISNGKYYIQRDDFEYEDIEDIPNGYTIEFVTPMQGSEDINTPKIVINDLDAVSIDSPTNLINNCRYKIHFFKASADYDYFEFMGEVTPMGEAQEDNPASPFCVDGTLGTILIVLSGGEYDNISTSRLAKQRAEWELYTRCRLLNNITINTVPLYWLDVNWLIQITLPDTQEKELYIVKSISTQGGIQSTQSITAMKYYPLYNNI